MGSLVGCLFWDDQRDSGVGGERVGQYEVLVIARTVSVTDAFRVKARMMV
jgi:hypothetical protein